MSKLANMLRAMDAFTAPAMSADQILRETGTVPSEPEPYEPQQECALADCHEAAELRDHLIDGGDIADDAPVVCHLCGAPVEPDALKVQTMADGGPLYPAGWMCKAHFVAGTKRLAAAIEREQRRRARREGGA